MQFERERYAEEEEEALRAALTPDQYVAHLKLHSDARRNRSGYHGVGRRESGRWQARKSYLPVRPLTTKQWDQQRATVGP